MNKITYILDSDVDEVLDSKLREVLSLCFDYQPVFKTQRFCEEMPKHRWFIEEGDLIAAHVALHEKEIYINEKRIKIGGIAEVCVHPNYRGKGLVKLLLTEAHNWLIENNYSFSVLFANHPNVYSPSGYRVINNLIRFYDTKVKTWKVELVPDAMVAILKEDIWPDGTVDLNGIKY
jgi:hypothetical protein